MDQAITVGMVMWGCAGALCVIAIIGGALYVLSLFADAFKH